MYLSFTKSKVGRDAYKVSKTWRLGFHAFSTEHFSTLRLCYLRDKRGTHYMEITKERRCYNDCGERREPKGFVADEWYRDTFGENDGK